MIPQVFMSILHHEHNTIPHTIIQVALHLLKACHLSLAASIPDLLDILVSLASHHDTGVAAAARQPLATELRLVVSDHLESCLWRTLVALPRIIRSSASDHDKIIAFNRLNSCLELLPSGQLHAVCHRGDLLRHLQHLTPRSLPH